MGRRKLYEMQVCKYCGNHNIYAFGYCRKCYQRFRYRDEHGISHDATLHQKSSDRTGEIIRCMQQGMSQIDIARKFGVTKQWVSKIKKRNMEGKEKWGNRHVANADFSHAFGAPNVQSTENGIETEKQN